MPEVDVLPLADAFAAADREAWLALVRKTLKGEDVGALTSRTADDIPIEPLYTAEDATPSPARPAFSGDGQRPWDLRAPVSHPEPATANRHALEELENGAASLLVSAAPEALEQVLQGVVLELAPVALDAGRRGREAAQRLADVAKGGPQAQLAFHVDPLGAFARDGRDPGLLDTTIDEDAGAMAPFVETYPKASFFLASARVVHEAGGTEAQELAFAIAASVRYVRALGDAGLSTEEAFRRVTLGFAADETYFTTIAKLRAARLLWAKLTAACEVSAPCVIEARSSRRMLTRLDAWNNMLRLTAAGFGAGLGGADAVVIEPFTTPLGAPTPFARRQARNTQLVLMEEANLGRVADPAGGAWFIENLTDQLARAAWRLFQDIERRGGLAAALVSGHIAEIVGRAREARQADYAAGRAKIIGVTLFPDPDGAPPPIEAPQAPDDAAADAANALSPIRWSEPFEEATHGR